MPPPPPPPDEPTTCQFCHTRYPHTSECAREYLHSKNRTWHNVNEFEFFPEDPQQPRIKAEPRSPSPFPPARDIQIKQEPRSPRDFSEPYGTLVRRESQVGLSIISPQIYPSSGNPTLSLTSMSICFRQFRENELLGNDRYRCRFRISKMNGASYFKKLERL